MPKKIDIKTILKNNPQIDIKKLKKGCKLSEELQNMGLEKKKYELATPYSRKRVVVEDSNEDPRTTHLCRF